MTAQTKKVTYTQRYCPKCRDVISTLKYCWTCGLDLDIEPELSSVYLKSCKNCQHVPLYDTELTDQYCRACGIDDPYVRGAE
jgi:hypothetical protein